MPFSGFTYTNVAGATTAVAGQTVQSAVWDNIHTDLATALTMVMSQLGSTPTYRNICWMNGGFEVWQHGAGASASIAVAASTTLYTADRWYLTTGANQAHTVSAVTGITNQSQLAGAIQRTAGQTGITSMVFGYPLDTDEIIRMRGQKVSLVFAAKAGATWSPASGTITATLFVGTGSVAKRGGGFTNETAVLSVSVNLTAGGAVISTSASSSVIVPLTSTQAELEIGWTPVGTAGATDTFTLDDLQLEVQNSPAAWTVTNYDRLPFATMLPGCKRFYQKTFPYGVAPATNAGMISALAAVSVATQRMYVDWNYPVECRVTASVTTYIPQTGSSTAFYDVTASTSVGSNIDANTLGPKGVLIYSTTSGSTTNDLCYIHADASAGI